MNDSYQGLAGEDQRLQSLDMLRGIALCGILVMNIGSFALPATAYSNPTVVDNSLFSNHIAFAITHLFFDQKMMGLFSLLFGASAMLFLEKLRMKNLSTWKFYYARIFWLLVFGILHGIFLWQGDILFYYALCGLLLFFFSYLPNKVVLIVGIVTFLAAIGVGEIGQHWLDQMSTYQAEHFNWAWHSSERDINDEISLRLGSYSDLLRYRIDTSELNLHYPLSFITRVFIGQGVLRAFGLMLVGMAFYRLGVFNNKPPKYLAITVLIIGFVIAGYGLWQQYQHDWAISYSMFRGRMFNHLATPLLVYAYTLFIVELTQQTQLRGLAQRIANGFSNYGRMAFSNYILQSLTCTTLFYGYGLAWFAQFNRWQLLMIVGVVVAVQIILSNLWLRFFNYGPLEWLWRCLTFFKLPPLSRT